MAVRAVRGVVHARASGFVAVLAVSVANAASPSVQGLGLPACGGTGTPNMFWDHTKCASGNGTNACCATVWSPRNAAECCQNCQSSAFGFECVAWEWGEADSACYVCSKEVLNHRGHKPNHTTGVLNHTREWPTREENVECPAGFVLHAAVYWQDSVPGPPTHPSGVDTENSTLDLCARKCSTFDKKCSAFELSTPPHTSSLTAYVSALCSMASVDVCLTTTCHDWTWPMLAYHCITLTCTVPYALCMQCRNLQLPSVARFVTATLIALPCPCIAPRICRYCFIFLDPLVLPFVPLSGNVTTCIVRGYIPPPSPPHPPPPSPTPPQLRLRSVFQSGMVLQANASTTIYGDCPPAQCAGKTVQVTLDSVVVGKSLLHGENGTFSVEIGTHFASLTPHTLVVTVVGDGELGCVNLTNVLFGEQYLCSGQSNMELTVSQCNNASAEIAAANHPFIRIAQVSMVSSRMAMPQLDATFSIPWSLTTPTSIPSFSALCYYFGREMFDQLGGNTPVGLVEAAVGGTYIQSFSTPSANAACNNTGLEPTGWVPCPPQKPGQPPYSPWGGSNTPSGLWNSMLHPLIYIDFRLVVWDQAEENLATDEAGVYTCLQDEMVRAWRSYWGSDLGFHLVQLPSFNYSEYLWIYKSPLGQMRLSQQASVNYLAGVTRAVTIDLADLHSPYTSVHNRQKQQVAKRVALNALSTTCGRHSINTGPVATLAVREGQQNVLVRVESAQSGVGSFKGSYGCIACCNQSAFEIETATVSGTASLSGAASTSWIRVSVGVPYQSSDGGVGIPLQVGTDANVIAVRYAYDSDVQCIYFDGDGLPLAPFILDVSLPF